MGWETSLKKYEALRASGKWDRTQVSENARLGEPQKNGRGDKSYKIRGLASHRKMGGITSLIKYEARRASEKWEGTSLIKYEAHRASGKWEALTTTTTRR